MLLSTFSRPRYSLTKPGHLLFLTVPLAHVIDMEPLLRPRHSDVKHAPFFFHIRVQNRLVVRCDAFIGIENKQSGTPAPSSCALSSEKRPPSASPWIVPEASVLWHTPPYGQTMPPPSGIPALSASWSRTSNSSSGFIRRYSAYSLM